MRYKPENVKLVITHNGVSDHGSVGEFTKNAIDSIYKCCGGLKVTW